MRNTARGRRPARIAVIAGVVLRAVALGAATLGNSCSESPPTKHVLAEATFAAFQTALFARDQKALRELVCHDARDAVAGLCRVDLTGRQPLQVLGVEQRGYEYRVLVRDPNLPKPTGVAADPFYVLTVEDGDMRVDLLGTARYLARSPQPAAAGTPPRSGIPAFTPAKLTPSELREAERWKRASAAGR